MKDFEDWLDIHYETLMDKFMRQMDKDFQEFALEQYQQSNTEDDWSEDL